MIVGGIYLGFCFNVGVLVVEVFIEKVSCCSNFEFGCVWMFGCVGWVLCVLIVGIMFIINNQFVFWLGFGCVFIFVVLFFFVKMDVFFFVMVVNVVGVNYLVFSFKLVLELFR